MGSPIGSEDLRLHILGDWTDFDGSNFSDRQTPSARGWLVLNDLTPIEQLRAFGFVHDVIVIPHH
jgi:hypothetical protein